MYVSLLYFYIEKYFFYLHLQTDPLSKAVNQLSAKLKVQPSQILLLRQDTELPVQSTAAELDLGIADIIGE